MKNVLAENMLRFGVKNLTESNIQKLNEENLGAFRQQALLSVPAEIVQVGVDILNKTTPQLIAAAEKATGSKFKASTPIVLKRAEQKGDGSSPSYYYGPISIYSLERGGKRIGNAKLEYKFIDFYNSKFSDTGQDQGLKDGEHYLNQNLVTNPNFLTELTERYVRSIKLMFNEFTWMNSIPELFTVYQTPGKKDMVKSKDYKDRVLGPAVKAARERAGEAVAKQIRARAQKFIALNKQQIAGISRPSQAQE